MRIACISASNVPSRAANSLQVMKVCQALVDLDHEIALWVPGNNPAMDWEAIAEHYGLRDRFMVEWIPSVPRLRRYDFALRAVARARRWGADLYYAWPYQAAALASQLGRPTVLEMHDQPTGRFGQALFRWFLKGRGARRILPTTKVLKDMLEEQFSTCFRAGFAVVSPNGVDLSRYEDLSSPESMRTDLQLAPGPTVGYTGHLYEGRGMGMVVELARMNPKVTFLVAGGEPRDVDVWRARIQTEGLSNISLLGFIPNKRLARVQGACDILIMPHSQKVLDSSGMDIAAVTNPMKSFEYLASGRAILASDLPILHEVLHEGNAIFLPPEDVEAWDRMLKNVLGDAELRDRLGARARKDARQYTWLAREQRALHGLRFDGDD